MSIVICCCGVRRSAAGALFGCPKFPYWLFRYAKPPYLGSVLRASLYVGLPRFRNATACGGKPPLELEGKFSISAIRARNLSSLMRAFLGSPLPRVPRIRSRLMTPSPGPPLVLGPEWYVLIFLLGGREASLVWRLPIWGESTPGVMGCSAPSGKSDCGCLESA